MITARLMNLTKISEIFDKLISIISLLLNHFEFDNYIVCFLRKLRYFGQIRSKAILLKKNYKEKWRAEGREVDQDRPGSVT